MKRRLRRIAGVCLALIAGWYLTCVAMLFLLRWVNPPLTSVQAQRRVESWFQRRAYAKRRQWAPLHNISLELRHAVIAAEDGRFFQHHGIDWLEMRKVVEETAGRGRPLRGASTITQQLVKNLFLTTHGGLLRKAAEYALVPVAEAALSKQRILELYLNVAEWGPGVWGAEAAARFHYGVSATALSRNQAARLAAILPAPRARRPARMNEYSAEILERMARQGW